MINRIVVVVMVSISIILPIFLYTKTPSISSQQKELNQTGVILVNEDEGIVIDDVAYNFGQTLVDKFISESNFDAKATNFADAFNALENGQVKYVIVIDAKFSQAINSYDSLNQVQGEVRYYYNHSYDNSVEGNVQSENERNQVFELLQDELSKIYVKTIIANVETTKEMLRQDIDSDAKLSEDIKITSKNNSARLESEIDSASEFVSTFENNMDEKISVVDENIKNVKDTEEIIVNSAKEQEELITSSNEFYKTLQETTSNNYTTSRNDYYDYSNLWVGDNGVSDYITNTLIPTYNNYDLIYKNNFNNVGTIINLDSQGFTNIALPTYEESDYTALKNYLANIQMSTLNVATNEIITMPLLSSEEINIIVTNAYNSATTIYNNSNSSSLNEMYKLNKSMLLAEINEEAISKSINISSFQVIPSGDKLLESSEVADFNAFNKFMAILNETEEFIELDENSDNYMSEANIATFNELKTIILNEYIPYGGSYNSVVDIVNDNSLGYPNNLYGLHSLNASNNSIINYLQKETYQSNLLNGYAVSLFFDSLEESVMATFSSKYLNTTMSNFNNEVLLFINNSVNESNKLLADYETKYNTNLTKLNEDSTLIVSNYETSSKINATIIELGNINLDSYEVMSDNNKLVKEENKRINEYGKGVSENNEKINEAVVKTDEAYQTSLNSLEEANNNQEKFVSEYEKVLEYANVNGVSNTNFYNFITTPIDYTKEDVGKGISQVSTYLIISWLFSGLLLINAMYDKFRTSLTLRLSRGDFKNNFATTLLNNNLVYLLLTLLFGLLYAIVIVRKYRIDDPSYFIGEIMIIAILVSYIMKKLIEMSRFIGYSIIIFSISIMYILLFTSNNSLIVNVISSPLTAIDKLLMTNIYQIPNSNTFINTTIIYLIIALLIIVVSYITKLIKRREV